MLAQVVGALVGVVLLGVLAYQHSQARPVRRLPGPFSYPIIGNIPNLLKRPWTTFSAFAEKYGGIYKVYVQ